MSEQSPRPFYHFSLLGELEITKVIPEGSIRIPPPPHRTHTLLLGLLLRPRPLARERLAGWLFPDLPEKTGRQRLSDLLWVVRKALPDLPLQTSNKDVLLPADARWLDVEAFQKYAAQDDPPNWLAAINLYKGPLLTNGLGGWLNEESESLYLQYIRLLHRCVSHLAQNQQFEAALHLAQRLIQEEPYDEKALRLLMRAHHALGQRGAALAAYEHFVVLIQEELKIEPEPATQELAQAIQTAAITLRSAPTITVDASPESLLQQARLALDRAYRSAVETCLQRLGTLLPACTNQHSPLCTAYKLLQVDLALLYDEYDTAGRVLATCDAAQPAVMARQARLDYFAGRSEQAHDRAEQALLCAYETGNQQDQLEALLVLARVQWGLSKGTQALVSVEQALILARQFGMPASIARARLIQGFTLIHQGRQNEATRCFHEVLSLAHEHDLQAHRGEAWHGLGIILSNQGRLLEAEKYSKKALQTWRDLGMRSEEARVLQTLAMHDSQLGRNAEGLRLLAQARTIYKQIGSRFWLAYNQYCQASLLQSYDDSLLPDSIQVASAALNTFRELKMPGWEAATLTILGYSLWLTEQHQQALTTLRQAYRIQSDVGDVLYLPEVLLIQGLAHLGLGQKAQALDCTRRALLALAQGAADQQYASSIYYAHAVVLEALGQKQEAHDYFKRGYKSLLQDAAQLQDEPAREAFFHRDPIVRRLMEEAHSRDIAPPPTANVVTRLMPALTGARLIPVHLTLDAGPADAAIRQSQGKVALRRARLARILQEAESQGADPTAADIAQLLDVSKRTVQRDQAFLQQSP